MKKIICSAFFSLLLVSACQKSGVNTDTTSSLKDETVNVNLNSDQTYQYSITSSTDRVVIATDAQNAAQSRIASVPGTSEQSTYEYVPASGFTGTDLVTIEVLPIGTTKEPVPTTSANTCQNSNHSGCGQQNAQHHGKCEKQHENCKKGQKQNCSKSSTTGSRKITFNFTVNKAQ